jgi:hypothetical protein
MNADQTARNRTSRHGRRLTAGLVVTVALATLVVLGAVAYVAFVLWPRQLAEVPPDTPSVPVTIAGVPFNVPPAAIRVPVQRRPGAQERLDLVFMWPSFEPPDPKQPAMEKNFPADQLQPIDRLFVTIHGNDGTLPPIERVKAIYPRYFTGDPQVDVAGLIARRFADTSPYKDEDLVFDPVRPERFVVRCNRAAATPGMCLLERRIGGADIIVRFPRDWLFQWQDLSEGVDRLIASLRPVGR